MTKIYSIPLMIAGWFLVIGCSDTGFEGDAGFSSKRNNGKSDDLQNGQNPPFGNEPLFGDGSDQSLGDSAFDHDMQPSADDSTLEFEESGLTFVRTKVVAAVFEDSNRTKDHKQRDIRVCVKGNFGYHENTRKIVGGASVPQRIEINAYKVAAAACRHRFHIEIWSAAGQKIHEEDYETSSNNNFNQATVELSRGDELRLAWSHISGSPCAVNGRDYHTRTSRVDGRPAPKIHLDSCGDFSP